MKHWMLTLSAGVLCVFSASAKDVTAALTEIDAGKRDMEYREYEDLYKFYAKQGIQTGLLDYGMFSDKTSANTLLAELKKYQVVFFRMKDETSRITLMNDENRWKAMEVGKVLKRYVESGGGLIFGVAAVRYRGHDDEKFWNIVMKPLGMQLTREGVADAKHLVKNEWKRGFYSDFFETKNIAKHPVTEGVDSLWLPVYSYTRSSGTPYMEYSKDWTVIVRGGKDASTFLQGDTNHIELDKPGSVRSEPAVIAVRTLGKGRIVCLPVNYVHTGQNWKKPTWSHIVEGKDGEKLLKLIANAFHWCAEPNQDNPAFGTWKPTPYQRIQFPESVSFDGNQYGAIHKGPFHKIIFGAHTAYSDGKSTVAEYAEAAKKAGLSGIVFADPLELLTKEKFDALKKDCTALTTTDFLVLPGVEFTDGDGIRHYAAGNKIVWPGNYIYKKGNRDYQLWDGKRILLYGTYMDHCAFPTAAILDYKQMESCKVRRENLWWFWQIIPYVYENGKLITDNRKEYDLGLKDLRRIEPIPFTRIYTAGDVAKAAEQEVLVGSNLSLMKDALVKGSARHTRRNAEMSLSIGGNGAVLIRAWKGINFQQDPRPLKTRGTQRARMMFVVESADGIQEVKVMDGESGKAVRVFDAKGAKEFSREFEMVHDRNYHIYLDVVDTKGNQAISDPYYIFDYKQSLARCGDNLNILGPLGYWWHPDRPEFLPLVKLFRNAEKLSVQGWDRAAADCPHPTGRNNLELYLKDGCLTDTILPDVSQFMRMRTECLSGELQIVNSTIDEFAERCDTAKRPGPSMSSPAMIMAKNPYVSMQERFYSPRDRMDFHIAWDNRRYLESIEDYDGSLQIFEGEITVLKDMPLSETAPVPVMLGQTLMEPYSSGKNQPKKLLVNSDCKEFTAEQQDSVVGILKPFEFAAVQQSMVGTIAFVPLTDNGWRYNFRARDGVMMFGIGKPGEIIKAGTKIPFLYASISVPGTDRIPERVQERIAALRGAFPFSAKIGSRIAGNGVFRVQADNHQALFTAGPAKPGIDWPFGVSGIVSNGCAAVFTSERPWLRFIPCTKEGIAYFQESIDKENHIWCGNVFTADFHDITVTLVADGQDAGKLPFVELHNPTEKPVKTTVQSAAGVPVFGGISFTVEVPAKDSLRRTITKEELQASGKGIADPVLQSAAETYSRKLGK